MHGVKGWRALPFASNLPLRVAAGVGLGLPVDPKDPAFWDSTAICEWVATVAADASFDAAALCGGRSGREDGL